MRTFDCGETILHTLQPTPFSMFAVRALMSYARLTDRVKTREDLKNASAILSWDDAVMMPPGGSDARAESLATLASLSHEFLAAPETGELIEAAREESLDPWDSANLQHISRSHRRAKAVPSDLVSAISRARSKCEQLWRDARGRHDWKSVRPLLETLFDLTRKKADCLAESAGVEPYDALIDTYESGVTQALIDPLFAKLKGALPSMIDDALARQRRVIPLGERFDESKQLVLAREIMRGLGFDFDRGRLDLSHHPFCGGLPDDTRITTRFGEGDFLQMLFATIHETGHALYQQGLPKAWRSQPVGAPCGQMLHESQSLFMEMQVARSRPFLEYARPVMLESFGIEESDPAWSLDNLLAALTWVEKGRIRVEADEMTYPLHVVLRYEIERELMNERMRISDVPDAWNESMDRYLGLDTRGDFKDGCMQDVHWYSGVFGYFPCYTLGALAAAQFMRAMRNDLSDIAENVGTGNFSYITDWLRTNIHSWGCVEPGLEVLERVTGDPLDETAFLVHLQSRYLAGR